MENESNKILSDVEYYEVLKHILENLKDADINGNKIVTNIDMESLVVTFNETIPLSDFTTSKTYKDFLNSYIVNGTWGMITNLYPDKDIEQMPMTSYVGSGAIISISIV